MLRSCCFVAGLLSATALSMQRIHVLHHAGNPPHASRYTFPTMCDRRRDPGDDGFDPTVDIPTNATLADLQPKGIGGILSGLPWWFPLAIGWFLAPNLGVQLPEDIFRAPTAAQERQILRDERSMFSDELERELYGK